MPVHIFLPAGECSTVTMIKRRVSKETSFFLKEWLKRASLPKCRWRICPPVASTTKRESTEETDPPLRGWDGYCGTYVGCKLLAEKLVFEYPKTYVLRLRLPFDNLDHPRNYLSKIAAFPTIFDHTNSLTHRGDFAKAALDLVELRAPYGIYNCVNPGQLSARQMIIGMQVRSIIDRCPEIEENPPVSGTRLSTTKLISVGIKIRSVEEAMQHALDNWMKS